MKKSLAPLLALTLMASAAPAFAGNNGFNPGHGDLIAGRHRNNDRIRQMHNNRLANIQEHRLHNQEINNPNLPRLQMPVLHGNIRNQIDWDGRKFELDLRSTLTEVVLGSKLFKEIPSVTITVGDTEKTFSAGDRVTASEYIAIKQELAGDNQTLFLNSDGSASGGSFVMNGLVTPRVNQLVIPNGVTAVDDFAHGRTIGIRGDLLNFGTIYGYSTDEQINSGRLIARNISNFYGGLISTELPTAMFSDQINEVSLSLIAMNNISNSGKINSSGNLSLTAVNGSILNNGGAFFPRPPIIIGPPVVERPQIASSDIMIYPLPPTYPLPPIYRQPGELTARGDINLTAGSGHFSNRGHIESYSGNININTVQADKDITMSSMNGTYTALNGDINVRTPDYAGNNNLNMFGGDFTAKNINLYSGTGKISGGIGEVTGTLRTVGDTTDFSHGLDWWKIIPMPFPYEPYPIDPPVMILN